ncbi:epidermal retinol dehydrogenase 2 [Eupeodes corollae]|uniref:epidermal retinol dehydrogenase 2 n=1 Tax=Eupeodes corollae TaxID=290404 RepID=UPI002491AB10|nr:epidermal retinol dehydrogenase 2 [Eupeodes corollae]
MVEAEASEKRQRLIFNLKIIVCLLLLPLILFAVALKHLLDYLFGSKEKDVKGKVVLITGGGSGLGKEMAILLAKKGCKIAVVDVNTKAGNETIEIISKIPGAIAKTYRTDVSSYREIQVLAVKIEKDLGPVDILINNAALMSLNSTPNLKAEEIERIILVNLGSYILTTKEFLPKMIARKSGHIVAVSSLAGLIALPGAGIYSATKYAIIGFMDCLRAELRLSDCDFIRTTTAHPYFMKTNAEVYETLNDLGVLSRYPCMSGSYTAEKIVQGILRNERMVYVPKMFALVVWLHRLLPVKWQDYTLLQFYDSTSNKLAQFYWK